MNSLLLDFRTALRFFARRRAAFAVIVFTMALALGANTTVFSVLKSFLFSGLGLPDSGRVVVVWATRNIPGQGRADFNEAYPNYQLLRGSTHFWEKIACVSLNDVNWEQGVNNRRLQAARVTSDFFAVMRVATVLGRSFIEKEQGPNAAPVAVIGDALWRSAFAGSPDVLGRTLRLNGTPYTIVGVLAPKFGQPQGTDVWLPFDLPADQWTKRSGAHQLFLYARLASGATVASADRELKAFAPRALEASAENKDWGWRVQPLRDALLAGADNTLILVQSGAAILLVLAISNLASLLLAWAAERQSESAVRLALGAAPWQLARQFLVQSLILVAIGGALGTLLAATALPLLRQLNPIPALAGFLAGVRLDAVTLAFAAALVLGAGLLAGLLPAWQSRRTSLIDALRSESRGASLSRAAIRSQQVMVIVQTAISVLILSAAALAGVGFWKLSQVRLGYATDRRVVFHFQFPEPAYATPEKRVEFVRTLEQNLALEPTLAGYGVTSTLPIVDLPSARPFFPELPAGGFAEDPVMFNYRRMSSDYMTAMGIPVIEGRSIDEGDRAGSPAVAVISQALAAKYWPGRSALHRRLRRTTPANAPFVEIVGVVGTVRDEGLGATSDEAVYVPFEQESTRRCSVVLHGRGLTADTLAAGLHALRATSPGVAAYDISTLEELAWQSTALQRLQVFLLGVFATIAVGITALGSYGVMSQLVANRKKELAIRAALGATPRSALCLILAHNARLAATGSAVGLAAVWPATRLMQTQLTGFDASSLWPCVVVGLGVLALTQFASLIPARRAARTDVMLALHTA